jgi:hypothetical protein
MSSDTKVILNRLMKSMVVMSLVPHILQTIQLCNPVTVSQIASPTAKFHRTSSESTWKASQGNKSLTFEK